MALLAGVLLAKALWPASVASKPVGLFTTLPILWSESADLAGLLAQDAPPHWAVAELSAGGRVVPLDALERMPGRVGLLVLAQPRPLSPAENVSLDRWLRQGGRVLLFADPMLTRESAFALGDKRRPIDTVLLSPILGRWGLRLEFDEAQAPGAREAEVLGATLPVNLPGRLVPVQAGARCAVLAAGLAVRCRLGKGRLLVVADAALLEEGLPDEATARAAALRRLLDAAAEQ